MAKRDVGSETIVPNWAPPDSVQSFEIQLRNLVSDESVAVPLTLADGTRVWYKRVLSEIEKRAKIAFDGGHQFMPEVTPLTLSEAKELVSQLKDQYENYQVAFDNHVASTQFILGSSRDEELVDREDTVVQMLQKKQILSQRLYFP